MQGCVKEGAGEICFLDVLPALVATPLIITSERAASCMHRSIHA